MITFHRHIKYIFFFILGGFLVYSFAPARAGAYYERTPSGQDDFTSVDVTIYEDNWAPFCSSYPTSTHFRFRVLLGDNSWLWVGNPTPLGGTLNAQISASSLGRTDNVNIVDSYISCYDALNDVFVDYNARNIGDNYVLLYTTPVAGAHIGFLKDTYTTTDMLASVKEGTQATTSKTLPLLFFAGVVIAFVILVMTSKTISDTVSGEKKRPPRGNGRGWTAHGVMEHDKAEFEKKERRRLKLEQ